MKDLKNEIRARERRRKRPHLIGFHSYEISRTDTFMGTETRSVVTGGRCGIGMNSKQAQVSYWGMTMF